MHEHEHDHDHAHHCHPHSHEHTGDKPMSPEEVLALLNYMLDHNRHHADELHIFRQLAHPLAQLRHLADARAAECAPRRKAAFPEKREPRSPPAGQWAFPAFW